MLIVILLPIFCGALVPVLPFRSRKQMDIYIEAAVLLNSILVFFMLFHRPEEVFTLFRLTGNLSVSFRLDDLGTVFAAIVSLLWPLASLYAFDYMKQEGHEKVFFMFYTMTYGITLGIALADDIMTMYCFYEMLPLVPLPLIMHTLSRNAILASRTYLYYSLGGAAFAFIGMIFILVYVLCFIGFSVKATMWPLGSWLPKAGVAPTPVTALLHAVAVVKAGAFATIRVTYYSFGTEFLKGTWAQDILMILAIITIVYGCSRALKETHFKRRLAYSTMSNLSYILFGALLMSPAGLVGALSHMIFHAIMKICSFFCAGAVISKTGKNYIHELDGMGRKMPVVFGVFTISGMALMGVPGLPGFISKWNLAKAAVLDGSPLALFGVGALMISALLTAIYMMTISVRAFFPGRDFDEGSLEGVSDPGWMMIVPLCCFVIFMFVLGLHSKPVIQALTKLAAFVK